MEAPIKEFSGGLELVLTKYWAPIVNRVLGFRHAHALLLGPHEHTAFMLAKRWCRSGWFKFLRCTVRWLSPNHNSRVKEIWSQNMSRRMSGRQTWPPSAKNMEAYVSLVCTNVSIHTCVHVVPVYGGQRVVRWLPCSRLLCSWQRSLPLNQRAPVCWSSQLPCSARWCKDCRQPTPTWFLYDCCRCCMPVQWELDPVTSPQSYHCLFAFFKE